MLGKGSKWCQSINDFEDVQNETAKILMAEELIIWNPMGELYNTLFHCCQIIFKARWFLQVKMRHDFLLGCYTGLVSIFCYRICTAWNIVSYKKNTLDLLW